MINKRWPLFLSLLFVAVAGCTCGEDLNRVDDEPEPADEGLPIEETPEPEPEPPPPDPVRELLYEGAVVADQPVGPEPLTLYFEEEADLSFLLTEEGRPVEGEPVVFQLEGDGVSLGGVAATTDDEGRATIHVSAGLVPGQATVAATAEFVAEPAAAEITVVEDPAADLEVLVLSETRIGVETADLFVKVAPAAELNACSTLIGPPADPTFSDALTVVPDSRSYPGVTTGDSVLVVAAGYGPTGDLIATGCTEYVGPLEGGSLATVEVTLQQMPSVLEGDYDVLMSMALGQLLPEPYESTVDFITGLLADPAGYAVYHALRQMDEETGTSFVHWEVMGQEELASFDDVMDNPGSFPTWSLARDFFHDQLVAELGQDYLDLTTLGGDLRDAVTDFEVGARFAITEDPAEDVEAQSLVIHELWNDLVFEWTRGCDPGDLGCIRRPIALENTSYAPVTSEYEGVWEHDPSMDESERFYVRTFPHRLALRYGAILLIALEELLYPELGADSLSGFFINLVDCQGVGESISDAIGGPALLYEGFCVTGMTLAAQQIEGELLELEVGEGDPELEPDASEGAVGESWMWLTDADHDLFTEEVPWLEYDVAWVDPDNPDISEEVAAPITGEGRLAASGCESDADCVVGETCQPLPSYLYVADVELDCRPAVGALLGEEPCAQDAECASGLCHQGTCFSACGDDTACGLGTCSDTGAALDLDDTMSGLGEAFAPSCVVP